MKPQPTQTLAHPCLLLRAGISTLALALALTALPGITRAQEVLNVS